MFAKNDVDLLAARLRRNDEERAGHPFSAEFVAAQSIIDEGRGGDRNEIARRLAEQGLPSVDEVGRITARHLMSWGKLSREAMTLQPKLDRLTKRGV